MFLDYLRYKFEKVEGATVRFDTHSPPFHRDTLV
ncbi:hypothetical protein ES702_06630 [subsurface metagenome]